MGIVERLREGLQQTRQNLIGRITDAIIGRSKIDDDLMDEVEDILLQTDVGVNMVSKIIDNIRDRIDKESANAPERIVPFLKDEIRSVFMTERAPAGPLPPSSSTRPHVILMVGVNGTGKTTTIGKLAYRYKNQGNKVLLAAADTFRAAAIEQLEIWADRADVDIVSHQMGADPASVAFDSFKAARAREVDVLIIDTAGRLQTKVNLMEEVKKIKRVLTKQQEGIPQETLMVLDATTGQNGISQAKRFHEALNLTGIVLTKLDGTAKGGIVVAIKDQLNIPVTMIGIGENIEDLRDFDPEEFVDALFG
ncbi:MAG: signal recognition particle-docking protein FtsY [Gemmatimonadota bacterium]|nr:MAG: signal recognition particle-docking protein FtsY [Gemmatimonadota bacterium]